MYFDRQAVAVVARDVRRVETHHRARFDNEILENFVHSGAEMDVGIRIRWTVVKNELFGRPSLACRIRSVKIDLPPFFEASGFVLRRGSPSAKRQSSAD